SERGQIFASAPASAISEYMISVAHSAPGKLAPEYRCPLSAKRLGTNPQPLRKSMLSYMRTPCARRYVKQQVRCWPSEKCLAVNCWRRRVSKSRSQYVAKELALLRSVFRAGNPFGLIDAVIFCDEMKEPLPSWAVEPIAARYVSLLRGEKQK